MTTRVVREEDGQVFPLMLFLLLATIVGGWLLFEVGKASVLRSDAQTAADAAALAGTRNVRDQIELQLKTTGTVNMAAIVDAPVRAAAESFARKNGARVTSYERFGVDVRVEVRTDDAAGEGDEAGGDVRERRGEARARASMSFVPFGGAGAAGVLGGGGVGGALVSGVKKIADGDWDDFAKELGGPPFSSKDVGGLGHFLEDHGIDVSEHPEFGGAAPGVHGTYGVNDHYSGGAIDVNVYPPGAGDANEAAVFDRLKPQIEELGFQVLWRAPNHAPGDNSHMHVDIGPGGRGGGGSSGGGGGGLGGLASAAFPFAGDSTGEIKLVPWEGGASLFSGIDPTVGNPFGAPDLQIACKIFTYAERNDLGPKMLLAGMEAAIVESGVHNLSWGDRDSLGVFQQRPSVGEWGTAAQILNVDHAIMAFYRAASRYDRPGQSAGQLAQATQRSAFPLRYDQVAGQAQGLIEKMEKGCDGGRYSAGGGED